ncbi:MAG: hypothetical protein NUV65_04010 [Candidatus Roizmanbacteria bacterium]|nr:hypothetical protein [Candidatus Roizmanbacteria bacterium]
MNIKTKLDIAKQKVVGVAQQVKGEAEVMSGKQVKGNVDKIRGKANEMAADFRSKVENAK